MNNYDASQVGVPYVRTRQLIIDWPDNNATPRATIVHGTTVGTNALLYLGPGLALPLASALVVVVLGFALQGIGHKREAEQPVPFEGPADFVARIFTEQFVTFPRFVLTGHWLRHLAGVRSKE